MSWYRETKLVFNSLRSIVRPPRILPESPFPTAFSRFLQHGSSNPCALFSGFSSISSRNAGLGLLNSAGKTNTSAFNMFPSCPKRFYCLDRVHLKPRGPKRWFQNPRIVLTVVLLGSLIASPWVFATVYIKPWCFETIPYTNRRHFVGMSKSMEEQIGEDLFQKIKDDFKDKILPATHPDSIRVKMIAKDIIDALQRDLNLERARRELGDASMDRAVKGTVKETMREMKWSEEDNSLYARWIRKGTEKGSKPMISHLEGLNWEVIVIDNPIIKATGLPSGKIVVFNGLLKHLKTDAEIATMVSHEVGHVVARHKAEGVTKLAICLRIFRKVSFVMSERVIARHHENLGETLLEIEKIEADHIGLFLLALAGYDPRVALGTYEKLGKLEVESVLRDYLSSNPSGKKRAQLLAQANAMEEALMIYRQVQSSRGIEDVL